MAERLDYENSCRRLHALGWLSEATPPPLPDHRPQYDDEEPLGVNFFRTLVEGDLSGLTLPRTFIGRSAITGVSFHNTNLQDSTLCWNDFIDVDFSQSVLAESDLRASQFERVTFKNTDLRAADLRQSSFTSCVFDGALMARAILTRPQAKTMRLSLIQQLAIDWCNDDGEEPDGG